MCDNAPGYAAVNQPPDHPGLAALRTLTQNGVDIADPRCQTLLTLLSNSVPNSSAPVLQQPDRRVPPQHLVEPLVMHRNHDPPQGHHPQPSKNIQPAADPALSDAPVYQDEPIQAQSSFFQHGLQPHASSMPPPEGHPPQSQGVPLNVKLFEPQQQPYPIIQGYSYRNPSLQQYRQLHWGQRQGNPEQGVPYMQPAQNYSYPLQPQNVHASYARHIVPQPALSHTPNHAFSFEDNQHAIMSRRLLIEEQVAARTRMSQQSVFGAGYRPQVPNSGPSDNHPPYSQGMHHAQQPVVDPSQHFVEMYSPRATHRRTKSYPGSQQHRQPAPPGRSRAAEETAESEAERQMRALDLLSLHGGNGVQVEQSNGRAPQDVPKEEQRPSRAVGVLRKPGGNLPSTSAMHLALPASKQKVDGTPTAPQGQSGARPRTCLDFLLTDENLTPQARASPAESSFGPNGTRGEPPSGALGLNLINEFIPDLPNGSINFGSDNLLQSHINAFSLQDVSAADSVFRAAASAVEKDAVPNGTTSAPKVKAKARKKSRKPRKPKEPNESSKSKDPSKLNDPNETKEKKPKRPRKPRKPKQPKNPNEVPTPGTIGSLPTSVAPVALNANSVAEYLNSTTTVPVASSAAVGVAADVRAQGTANPAGKPDEKAKPKKRRRSPKKASKLRAAAEQGQQSTATVGVKGFISEQVLEEGRPSFPQTTASQPKARPPGQAPRPAPPGAPGPSSQLLSLVSGHIGTGSHSLPANYSHANPNGVIPGQFPRNAVSQVTEKHPKPRKRGIKNATASQSSNPVMNRIQHNLEQRVDGVQLNHVFQIKAQVDAYRRISRGVEPPTEVTIASGGPSPVTSDVFDGLIIPGDLLQKGTYQADFQNSARQCVVPATSAHSQQSNAAVSQTLPVAKSGKERLNSYRRKSLEVTRKKRAELNAQRLANAHTLQQRAQALERQAHVIDSSIIASESSVNAPAPRVQVPGKSNLNLARQHAAQRTAAAVNGLPAAAVSSSARAPTTVPKHVLHTGRKGSASNAAPKTSAKPKRAPRKTKKALSVVKDGIAKKPSAKSVALKNAASAVTIAAPQYNGKTFRELLMEREQRISMRIQRRLNELAQLPADIPEDIRRRAIIEKKQLNLLSLQRKARASVTDVMHALFCKGNSVLVGSDSINRFRRPTPAHWSWRNPGASVQSNGGTLSAQARKNVQKLERQHRDEQERRRRSRQVAIMEKLLVHAQEYRSSQFARLALHKKLMKDLDRYFANRARKEEQRRKKENHDRLRALRENNEDEYLKLVKSTKNKRLLQLLKQTDQYLSQIGAQVERQKEAAKRDDLDGETEEKSIAVPEEVAPGKEAEKTENEEDDDLLAMKQRRNEYYTVTHAVKEKVFQPKTLIGGKLKPYQIEGLEWLVSLFNNNLNGILADEMGLGKTIQTLSLITYLVEVKKVSGPYLIIVPLSTMSNWVRELDRWAPSLSKVVYRGDPSTRRGIQQRQMSNSNYNVLLTTYEFIVRDKNVLGKIKWKYIIIDEGHRMKNSDCKLALTLGSKYTSRNRILLTGTPLQNNLTELWALLNFLLPTIFSNSDTFETWFNAPFQAASLGGNAELNEEENLLVISRLHQVLRPFMLRRLKTDVECQLPEKVEEVLKCEMSVWQRVLYRQMRARLGIAAGGSTGSTRSFNNMVMQLKKVCNHPYLFYNDEELASLPHDNLVRTSGKFELLNHALKKLKATGHRVLMFSQMTAALDYLELFLMNIGIKCLRLDGTTKADDRQEMLEKFNAEDSPYFCFLLSTRAGGLGLNLQSADTVIIFDSDWNPMMDLQAQDRAHRIGQTKEVRVFRLICSGSIEVKILERANRKLKMDAQVIQAGQFNNKSSDNDRQEMLKDILRNQGDDDDLYKSDVSSLEGINRMLARTDEELELFEEMDRERLARAARQGRPPLMIDESEIPAWVLLPEVEQKSKEQLDAEYIEQHGRGLRKRKAVVYEDNLTEREWTQAIEEDVDIDEAIIRKKRRKQSQSQSAEEEDTEGSTEVKKVEALAKEPSPSPAAESIGNVASASASMDRESSSSVQPEKGRTKLEPFVDPDLHKPSRPRRGRGRPRKQR